nr:ATP synthase subunit 8 [Savius diagonalis]
MPQMSNMWWEMLYILFLMKFMMMIIIIYYTKIMTHSKLNKMNIFIKQLNWKW